MIGDSQEIEVKFYLTDPERFNRRLIEAGAILKRPRCHETDLRFDDATGNLRATGQVLRLRKDNLVTLTYKGAGEVMAGVLSRREIEVTVSDFDITRELLEAVGYRTCLMYEKYRTALDFNQCEVVLDEMPYGWFCEIEGPSPLSIKQAAELLALRWETRIQESYALMFVHCQDALGLTFSNLSFSNFRDVAVTPRDLGVSPADI